MATVYCAACAFAYTKGGVTYCGCPGCPMKDKSVSSTSAKSAAILKADKVDNKKSGDQSVLVT